MFCAKFGIPRSVIFHARVVHVSERHRACTAQQHRTRIYSERVSLSISLLAVLQGDVDLEIREIEFVDRDSTGSLKELLTEWGAPLAVTTTLSVCQQLTGQSNVLNFTQEIFRKSHFRAAAPAVVLGFVKVLSTIIAIVYVSNLGDPWVGG